MTAASSSQTDVRINIGTDVDLVAKFLKDSVSDGKIDRKYLELYKAAVKGNVRKAESCFGERDKYRLILCSYITQRRRTVLHIAAGAKQTRFIKKMLTFIQPNDLELQDSNGNNAFCFAAMAGAKPIAEMMLKKKPDLLRIRGGANMTPLYLAALFGQKEMATFLYKEYKGSEVEDVEDIFYASMRYNLYDLAWKLLNRNSKLALVRYKGHGTALHMLAQNPTAFASRGIFGNSSTPALKLLKCLWEKIEKQKGDNVWEYMRNNNQFLFDAAEVGNSKFLEVLIGFCPDLVHEVNKEGRTIFHIAILHRHAAIFNLMNDMGFDKQFVASLVDVEDNNILHLAAKYSPDIRRAVSMVPGAALEMQQELKTFKAVELLVLPSYREMKNKERLTPREVFTRDHKDLLERGEKWMKGTAKSCMLVATIIATVVFTAGFSLPGDDNNDSGGTTYQVTNPIFHKYAIADAIGLSSSTTSILMFLSILTSRYEEDDFLISLPVKLMVGLLTFLISIAAMMLSFSLNFFLVYINDKSKETPNLISVLVFVPAILFLLLYGHLFTGMLFSLVFSRFSCKAN